MDVKNKTLALLIAPKFQEDEVLAPRRYFSELGADVKIIGLQKGACPSKGQAIVEVDFSISEVHPNQFDALIIPGGSAPEALRQNRDVLRFVKTFMQEAKPVAAICHGPQVLISAGSLWCRTVTAYPGIRDDLVNAGAIFLDQEVVVDGNLVTSRVPGDLPAFNKAFAALLQKYDREKAPWAHASPAQVLEYAILNEVKAQVLYDNLAKKATDKLAKAKFKFLAEAERGHRERLEEIFERITHGKKPVPRDLGEKGEANEISDPGDDILKVLQMAINAEETANRLYSTIAEKMVNAEGRRMFEELAEEELSHRRLLETEYATRIGRSLPSAMEKEPWWSENLW